MDFWTHYLEAVAKPLSESKPQRTRRRTGGAKGKFHGRAPDPTLYRFLHADGREVVARAIDARRACELPQSSISALRLGRVRQAKGWTYGGLAG